MDTLSDSLISHTITSLEDLTNKIDILAKKFYVQRSQTEHRDKMSPEYTGMNEFAQLWEKTDNNLKEQFYEQIKSRTDIDIAVKWACLIALNKWKNQKNTL